MVAENALGFYERYWMPAELVISDMERSGIALDESACHAALETALMECDQLAYELHCWAGREINWKSPKQIAEHLYGERMFPVPPVKGTSRAVQITKEGEYPTGEASLQYLADHAEDYEERQALRTLLRYKKRTKEASFHELLPRYAVNGRIHCQLGPNTETGRLSAKNPNLQQMPPETREAFVAPSGYRLVCLDYSGLEWRILAHCLAHRYGDDTLVADIRAGLDPHSATAVRMFPECADCPVEEVKAQFPKQRDKAKILNYSVNYGKTAKGLGAQIRDDHGDPIGKEAGQQLLDGFYRANPGVKRFHEDIVKWAKAHGYTRSLLGRSRPIDFSGSRWQRQAAERLALNTPIQASAADIVTLAMLRTNPEPHPELVELGWWDKDLHRLGVRLLLQVHDELVYEVPEENAEEARQVIAHNMEHCLEGVRSFECPLEVTGGVGRTWKGAGK